MSNKKKINRRQFVKKASTAVAGAGVVAAGSGTGISLLSNTASAGGHDVRKDILRIPGVGKGSPTDSDWQKVGSMCLGPTESRVSKGEFKGVELTFMGLYNQNLHNFHQQIHHKPRNNLDLTVQYRHYHRYH